MDLLFSRQVPSNSVQPRGLQNARLRCPLLSWSLLRFMSIELVVLSNHLILCLLQKDPCSFCLQSSTGSGSFSNVLTPQLFEKPPQTTTLPPCISFSWGWFRSRPPVKCYKPPSISSGILSTKSNLLNIFITATVWD